MQSFEDIMYSYSEQLSVGTHDVIITDLLTAVVENVKLPPLNQ